MPIARVQLPDGRIGRFEVPEGMQPQEVESFAQQQFSAPQPAQPQPQEQEQAAPADISKTESFTRGAAQGATFGTSDEIYGGIKSLLRGVSRGIESKVYGDNVLQPISYREARDAEQGRNQAAQEANPISYTGGEITGALTTGAAGASTKAGTFVANSLRNSNPLMRFVKGAATGAASGAAYGAGTAEEGERGEGALEGGLAGAAVGGAIPAGGAAIRGVKNAVVPKIDEALKPLAKRARDFGIPLRADQVAPTRVRKTLQKASQELPFSGVDAFEDTQRRAWVSGVAQTIGESGDDLGPETIQNATKRISSMFDDALRGRDIEVDRTVIDRIKGIADDAGEALTGERAEIVKRQVQNFFKDIGDSGKISGDKLADFRSRVVKIGPRAEAGAREFLADIASAVDDSIKGGLSKEQKEALNTARKQWRNLKTIEPLLEESTDGTINPTKLLARVKSSKFIKASKSKVGDDDLVDLARIGKEFMTKLGGSDSYQKLGLVTAAGFTGANPLLGLTAATGTVIGNRALQSGINQNQRLIDAAIRRKPNKSPRIANAPLPALIAGSQAVQ